jgi:hypothetical protein
MKTIIHLKRVIFSAILMLIFVSCTKDDVPLTTNGLLKKVKNGDFITTVISYNNFNLISEVNSTSFWRKFSYNDHNQLIKEEIAVNPDMLSSSMHSSQTHGFVDPDKVGISMYRLFEYDNNGLLSRQLNYVPKDGQDELRSIITFEYNANNLIERLLLHDGDAELTQFRTYQYDSDGNVIEEDYYSYLFIPEGTGPKHLSKTTFEFDTYLNPYKIFEKSSGPGLSTNKNNITKSTTINYDPVPGQDPTTTSQISYEYNERTRYPTRVIGGEEFIYE